MPSWTEDTFKKEGEKIAKAYVDDKTPLIDGVVARVKEAALNYEQMCRLAEATNVAAFHAVKNAQDKGNELIEFEPADVKVAAMRLTTAGVELKKEASYNRDLDMYAPLPDMNAPVLEKVAEEVVDDTLPPHRVAQERVRLEKIAEDLTLQARSAEYRWRAMIEKVADELRSPTANSALFNKQARAAYGDDVVPELVAIAMIHHEPVEPLVKAAALVEYVTETPLMRMVKKAMEERKFCDECYAGAAYLAEQLK